MKATGDEREHGFDRLLGREFSRPAATADECPQVEALSAWFDHALPANEAAPIEAHLASCGRCQELVGHLARTEPEILYVHPKPGPVRWTWHLRWAAPLAVAAVLVFVVGTRSLLAPDTGAQVPRRTAAAKAAEVTAQRQERLPSAPPAARDSAAVPPAQLPSTPPPAQRMARAKAEPLPPRAVSAPPATPAPSAQAPGFAITEPAPPQMGQAAPAKVLADIAAPARTSSQAGKAEAIREENRAASASPARPAALAVQPASTAAQLSAFVPGSQVGWRYARRGVLLRTVDGGASWTPQPLPGDVRLLALSAVSPSVCWAAGAAGVIVRTVDGTTWQVIAGPTSEDLASIAALDERRATLRTASGVTYDTGDGGATWRQR